MQTCEAKQVNVGSIGECTWPGGGGVLSPGECYWFNEHLSDARLRKLDTPLGEHISDSHPELTNRDINSYFNIEILDKGTDCAEVKIRESIHIRNLKPTLNSVKALGR